MCVITYLSATRVVGWFRNDPDYWAEQKLTELLSLKPAFNIHLGLTNPCLYAF